ncbi:hypothetical protein EJ06DRAFT_533556 [Trichodelitschia bisporula]|uniref:Post-transcriptional regulator MKT1 C-terminal domain-containing protein n=1 Tax=Trichodelitschia bisporula TaxID=703511 RepID=A0A6G1HLP5_9PEZI|nr:hypothetical protein EJ06DRAFT_533556 [Trichodelitschia bisporula]
MKEATDPRPVVSQWNVPISRFGPEINKYPQSSLLSLCIKTLTNPNFAEKSITPKSFENQPLSDKDELLLNAVWRFLHLRGYINKDHSLTAWGRVLHTTLAALPSPHQEEAAILAIELARLGLLNANPMFLTYSGAPYRGTEETKRFILLISRVACLGRFSHKEIGYTGPLSRHLLGFHSMITAVRNGLRDLMEVCMTTLLLNGDATRDEDKDLTDLGLDLPFLLHNDCGLGLAVNSYLDEVSNAADPSAPETKKAAKTKGSQVLFLYSLDYAVDIDKAFALWDAVYKGLKTAGDMFPHQTVFDDANEFLSKMR